uniref:Chymotrypsin inhibitor n=1 Tax=Kassina senegalensis TaxID=8415 RepID=F8K9Q3_KASSE|nr:chymotrypsin inhibitor precursor [Kassina senegalensis]
MKTLILLTALTCSLLFMTSSTAADVPKFCDLSPDPGPCFGHMNHYYYDPSTNSCKPFVYGGCQGNGNNFQTVKECEIACRSVDG